MKPPVTKRIPHPHTLHQDVRKDDFYWLKNKNDPEFNDTNYYSGMAPCF